MVTLTWFIYYIYIYICTEMVSVIVTVASWMLMVDSVMICGTYFKHHRAPPWGSTSCMKDTHRTGSAVSICFCLVVLTILTNISQWEGLSHILWKIENVPNHQSAFEYVSIKEIVEVKFAWNKTRWTPRRLGSQPGGQWSCKGLIKLHIFAGLHYIVTLTSLVVALSDLASGYHGDAFWHANDSKCWQGAWSEQSSSMGNVFRPSFRDQTMRKCHYECLWLFICVKTCFKKEKTYVPRGGQLLVPSRSCWLYWIPTDVAWNTSCRNSNPNACSLIPILRF